MYRSKIIIADKLSKVPSLRSFLLFLRPLMNFSASALLRFSSTNLISPLNFNSLITASSVLCNSSRTIPKTKILGDFCTKIAFISLATCETLLKFIAGSGRVMPPKCHATPTRFNPKSIAIILHALHCPRARAVPQTRIPKSYRQTLQMLPQKMGIWRKTLKFHQILCLL